MEPDDACIEFVKKHEGVRYEPYLDSGGILTAGVGHTGSDIILGQHYTDDQVDAWLKHDLSMASAAVNQHVEMPLKQNQFNACVSLCFNIGTHAFSNSTLVRLLNDGDFAGAADQFLVWDKVNHKVVPGLFRRRVDERELFLS